MRHPVQTDWNVDWSVCVFGTRPLCVFDPPLRQTFYMLGMLFWNGLLLLCLLVSPTETATSTLCSEPVEPIMVQSLRVPGLSVKNQVVPTQLLQSCPPFPAQMSQAMPKLFPGTMRMKAGETRIFAGLFHYCSINN